MNLRSFFFLISCFSDCFNAFLIAVQSSHELVKSYALTLPDNIAQNVKRAVEAKQPAIIKYGLGTETSLSFNRRFLMKDGSVQFNPGKSNPIWPRWSISSFEIFCDAESGSKGEIVWPQIIFNLNFVATRHQMQTG